jgi:hypothetical protein
MVCLPVVNDLSDRKGKDWLVSSFELDSSIRNSFEFGHSLALQLEMLVN